MRIVSLVQFMFKKLSRTGPCKYIVLILCWVWLKANMSMTQVLGSIPKHIVDTYTSQKALTRYCQCLENNSFSDPVLYGKFQERRDFLDWIAFSYWHTMAEKIRCQSKARSHRWLAWLWSRLGILVVSHLQKMLDIIIKKMEHDRTQPRKDEDTDGRSSSHHRKNPL